MCTHELNSTNLPLKIHLQSLLTSQSLLTRVYLRQVQRRQTVAEFLVDVIARHDVVIRIVFLHVMALVEYQQGEDGQRRQLAAVERIEQNLRRHHHDVVDVDHVFQRHVGRLVTGHALAAVTGLQVLDEHLKLLIH